MSKSVTLVLRNVRCVWPKLYRPENFREKDRYSIGLLIEEGSDQAQKLGEAIKTAIAGQYGPQEVEAKLRKFKQTGVTKYPIKDFDDGATKIITPKRDAAKQAPIVLDGRKQRIPEEKGLPYGGCWVNASIDVFCHNREGGGLAFYLNGVQLVREDAVLGGGTRTAESIKDDFDDLGDTGVAEVSAEADDFI